MRATLAEFVDGKVGFEVYGVDDTEVLDNFLFHGLKCDNLFSPEIISRFNVDFRSTNLGTEEEPKVECKVTMTPIRKENYYSFTVKIVGEFTSVVIKYETLADAKKDAFLFQEMSKTTPEITCIRYTRETRRNPARVVLPMGDVFEGEFWK